MPKGIPFALFAFFADKHSEISVFSVAKNCCLVASDRHASHNQPNPADYFSRIFCGSFFTFFWPWQTKAHAGI